MSLEDMDEVNGADRKRRQACEVVARLGLAGRTAAWVEDLAITATPLTPILPSDMEAARILDQFGAPPEDVAETLAARPDPGRHADHWWLLEHAYGDVVGQLGKWLPLDWSGWFRPVPDSVGAVGRYLYVWLSLAALPHTLRCHRDHGVSDDVHNATIASVGASMRSHRALVGQGGLGGKDQWLLPLVLRGASYRLGRFRFDRADWGLNLHIPADGRLDPAACDESIARARTFFPLHFPGEPNQPEIGCHSWLLDEQLATYLPQDSNIVRFQRRFEIEANEYEVSDHDVLRFVFQRVCSSEEIPERLLTALPQETTMQRAYVTHLRSGRHWYNRSGSFPF